MMMMMGLGARWLVEGGCWHVEAALAAASSRSGGGSSSSSSSSSRGPDRKLLSVGPRLECRLGSKVFGLVSFYFQHALKLRPVP